MRTPLASLAACLAALALAACAPPTTKSAPSADAGAPAAAPEAAPTAEAALAVAAIPRGQYSAVSRTAVSVTGDLTLADNAMTFARAQSYQTAPAGVLDATAEYAPGTGPLAQALGVPPGTGLEVRRVTASQIGSGAPNGGLCGRDAVTFVILAAATGADNMPGLWLAAFKGANAPGAGQGARGDLCAIYTYAPASL
jgi:hypothetical protein